MGVLTNSCSEPNLDSVAAVPGSNRLINLRLHGAGETRQALAGLGERAAQFTGQNLLVLANLIPKTIKGLESQGMVLAADVGTQPEPVILTDTGLDVALE